MSSLFVFWHGLGAVLLLPGSSLYIPGTPLPFCVSSGSSPTVLFGSHDYYTDFITTGIKSLADCCLSVTIESEALMSHLPQLDIPQNLRRQIIKASQNKINSPPSVTVTVIGNPT